MTNSIILTNIFFNGETVDCDFFRSVMKNTKSGEEIIATRIKKPTYDTYWTTSNYWRQPAQGYLRFDDNFVYIKEEAFNVLMDYSSIEDLAEDSYFRPSNEYEGKMWKTQTPINNRQEKIWVLRWFKRDSEYEDLYICQIPISIVSSYDKIRDAFKKIK